MRMNFFQVRDRMRETVLPILFQTYDILWPIRGNSIDIVTIWYLTAALTGTPDPTVAAGQL